MAMTEKEFKAIVADAKRSFEKWPIEFGDDFRGVVFAARRLEGEAGGFDRASMLVDFNINGVELVSLCGAVLAMTINTLNRYCDQAHICEQHRMLLFRLMQQVSNDQLDKMKSERGDTKRETAMFVSTPAHGS